MADDELRKLDSGATTPRQARHREQGSAARPPADHPTCPALPDPGLSSPRTQTRGAKQRVQLHHGDAFGWLATRAEESVDVIITDPPYASLERHRAIGTTTRLTQAWFDTIANERLAEMFALLYRVLRPDSHCYVFSDPETAFVAKPAGEAAGFKFWKPLVWDKLAIGMGYHYRSRYEFILFFERGKRRLTDLGTADVLKAKRIRNGYPTEKPASLAHTLITQSTLPGQVVLDPFVGSGSTGVAALQAGRSFCGIDSSERAMDITRSRLAALDAVEADDVVPPPAQMSMF